MYQIHIELSTSHTSTKKLCVSVWHLIPIAFTYKLTFCATHKMIENPHSILCFPLNFHKKFISLPESRFHWRNQFMEYHLFWHHVVCNLKLVFVSLYRGKVEKKKCKNINLKTLFCCWLFWTIFVLVFVSLLLFSLCVHMVEITIYVLSFLIAIKHFHVAESMSTFAHTHTEGVATTTNTIRLFTYVYLCYAP